MKTAMGLAALSGFLIALFSAAQDGPEKTSKTEAEKSAQKTGAEEKKGPPPPAPGACFSLDRRVFDTTGELSPPDQERVQLLCEDFREQTGCPMAVVVLDRLSETGNASGKTREVAEMLLNQWKKTLDEPERSVLLLIALGDGRVAIWLGKDWGGDYDDLINEIIGKTVIPHLSRKDAEGRTQKPDVGAAVLAGTRDLASGLFRRKAAMQPVFGSVRDFVSKSWLWILMGLHLLGFIYVLSTKESQDWYLAGALFGLPILLGMAFVVAQESDPDGDPADRAVAFTAGGVPSAGGEACAAGQW